MPDDSRPTPDPTILTTEALQREVIRFQSDLHQVKELLQAKIDGITLVVTERYAWVKQLFENTERQRLEQKADTKAAVDAALAAQKDAAKELAIASDKAITKTETNTSELLRSLKTAADTETRALRSALDDLKETLAKVETRVTSMEQRKTGSLETRTGIYSAIGAAAVLITIVMIMATSVIN